MTQERNKKIIEVKDLKRGEAYFGTGRNFDIAIWTGTQFAGLRYKFGDVFIDEETHWDEDEHHGTFQPLRKLK
jgi:hypothetical protein